MIFRIFQKQATHLPLVDYTLTLYPNVDLSETTLIACQHLLGSTLAIFEALFRKGLKPENTYVLGKCYSTNGKVYQEFVNRGVKISPLSKAFDSRLSFDEQFQSYIENFIKGISVLREQKIIILDDGAELILFANDFLKNTKKIVGVEQTSSGHEKLKKVELNFPVINIARSEAKLKIESPMIADVAFNKINHYFKKQKLSCPKILIVGQGAIGKAVYQLLHHQYDVVAYDLLTHHLQFPGGFESRLIDFDVIIGATGQSIVVPGDFSKLKENVILISVSSSDREFSGSYLRRLTSQTDDCHKDYLVNGINLLNSGFPINFDGSEHSVAPEKIQFTRALLVAGVLQALNSKEDKGLIDLDYTTQKILTKEFQSYKYND